MASALLESLLHADPADAMASQPDWLAATRRAAADAVARDGLPGPRSESWKYTSLRALEQRAVANGDAGAATRSIDTARLDLPGIDGPRLVFVNGVFRADLSDTNSVAGLSVLPLSGASAQDLQSARAQLEREYSDAGDAFARLNTVLAVDGPLIRVDAGVSIAQPLHLVFVGAAAEREMAWNARAAIALGDGASLRLVEHHMDSGDSGAPTLGNFVSTATIGRGAHLDVVQIQDAAETATLIRRSEFTLADEATLSTHALEAGAQTMRHDFIVDLAGRGARLVSRGVFALRGRQHADTHLDVRHSACDTASDVTWRGVADQRSRGVFHGAITVAAGADGADARLSNKNLLLSPHAEIDTQPVLEIHADEVKAAHGATVGQLDEQALFYLRSRGLPPGEARRLLISAFCAAVLEDMVQPALRGHLEALLATRLPQVAEE